MAIKHPTRRHAREVAMQALFQIDQNPETDSDWIEQFVAERLDFPELEAFVSNLVVGVQEHRGTIDELLDRAARNWSVSRMAVVDRNIMRLAIFELRYRPEVPPKVAIDEALEICKRFSSAESVAFVNGILDRVAQLVRPE